MDPREFRLAQEVIANFADQNSSFGLNTLMGRILGLLFISEDPQSLDDMADKLDMSKGPISQVCRRLKDNGLIEKVWVPGDRKDYYKPVMNLFGRLFMNRNDQLEQNIKSVDRLYRKAEKHIGEEADYISERMQEMKKFYVLLQDHNEEFLGRWREQYRDVTTDKM